MKLPDIDKLKGRLLEASPILYVLAFIASLTVNILSFGGWTPSSIVTEIYEEMMFQRNVFYEIYQPEDFKIVGKFRGYHPPFGNILILQCGDGVTAIQNEQMFKSVKEGQVVKMRLVIAYYNYLDRWDDLKPVKREMIDFKYMTEGDTMKRMMAGNYRIQK